MFFFPPTNSRSVMVSPSYSAMVPPRSMTIIGACPGSTPMSPSLAGITTMSTGRDRRSFSGLTISNATGMGGVLQVSVGVRETSVRPSPQPPQGEGEIGTGHDHAVAARVSAFFTASSMVPTM